MKRIATRRETMERQQKMRSLWRIAELGVILAVCCAILHAQGRPNEYQVKAVYLYNFTRFVEWPAADAGAEGPFAICVLGDDPFGTALDSTVAGETVRGRNVVARRVGKAEDARICRILYVSSSEDGKWKEILTALGKSSVLTVSDMPKFSERGGMIEFVAKGDKVRFEVNLTNTTEAGLTLSSDLLKVAVGVKGNAHPGD